VIVREKVLPEFLIVLFIVFPELILLLMVALMEFLSLKKALMSVTGGATSMGGGLTRRLVTPMGLCSFMGAVEDQYASGWDPKGITHHHNSWSCCYMNRKSC